MDRQKCPQIHLGDSDDSADAVDDEVPGIDPPADATAGDVETFRDLGDSEEVELIASVMPMGDMAGSHGTPFYDPARRARRCV
jgi:hypothetical protein